MRDNDETVELVGELWDNDPSKNAIAFDFNDTITWIPRSLIGDFYEHESHTPLEPLYYVMVPEWFAEQEGLI